MISQLEKGKPNCAEINDIQEQIKAGVNGILLTQETAMNINSLECLERLY